LENRKAAVAGSFYSADPEILRQDLRKLFNEAQPGKNSGTLLAIITPHAGYPYSGVVAASSYNQIDPSKKYDNIFIIGSSHRTSYEGASIYNKGNYETPLGTVKVNLELANKLMKDSKFFFYNPPAHTQEHSIEVQLPFLQYYMQKDFRIIPILLGTHAADICYEIAKVLYPYFNEKNLFIISTDFSHYPDYDNACLIDKQTAEAIQSNSVETFVNSINSNMEKNIPGLATCICAWPSVLTLLYMTGDDPDIHIDLINYRNSGDSQIGDKSRVVGYYSISFSRNNKTIPTDKIKKDNHDMTDQIFELQDQDKKRLLEIARNTLEKYIWEREVPEIDTGKLSKNLLAKAGAFVTLNKDGNLRGCIGRFSPGEPLYKVVQEMTVSSSTKDYRFTPVTPPELDNIDIEISVLTPLQKIENIDEIELGRHGIYIKKGFQSGTFLPQVADKTGWTVEEFLGHCARDKAQIGWDGWKEAEIYIYEAIIFSEEEFHQQDGLK
jgi:AmmeMemoRadiSam system protein B/AmmeMemoRadiSam system protein A